MKIELNVSDFFLETDEGSFNIEKEFKKEIIYETVNHIKAKFKEQIDDQIKKEVSQLIENTMQSGITETIKSVLSEGKIKSSKSSEQVTFEEYIREKILNETGWRGFDESLERIADALSVDLKKRYDILFASQIVDKLSQNGLLKDDAIKLPLNPSILTNLVHQLYNHATLISQGVPNEQALKIAIGDKKATEAIKAIKDLTREQTETI